MGTYACIWMDRSTGDQHAHHQVHIDAATGTVIDTEVKKGEKKKDKKGK